jgi:O-antigen ligase
LIGFAELYFGRNILYEYLMVNPYYLRYVGANSRMMSTQLNPAVMGSYLVACLPFCFYCLRRNGYSRLLGIVSTILSFAAAILTFSRGVFLALTVVSLLYLFKSAKFRVAIFFILLIGLFITSASFQQDNRLKRFSYNRLISGSYDSIFSEYRFSRVKMSLRMLKSHPFFGIGHNHFRPLFNDYCAGGNCKKEPSQGLLVLPAFWSLSIQCLKRKFDQE